MMPKTVERRRKPLLIPSRGPGWPEEHSPLIVIDADNILAVIVKERHNFTTDEP